MLTAIIRKNKMMLIVIMGVKLRLKSLDFRNYCIRYMLLVKYYPLDVFDWLCMIEKIMKYSKPPKTTSRP